MSGQKPVKEKVTTIGEGGRRYWLYPAKFSGDWLNRRRVVAVILILFFFLLPLVKVAGHQAVLIDIADRKFAFFGMVFWPQDTLIFWFFLAGGLILIILITAQWGRLWCGWACPQTVFLEHVFRRIEIMIEGDASKRRKLDKGPWNTEKVIKKALKYAIFLIISSHFANTVLCYFVGTEQVVEMTFRPPSENWGWFTFMVFFNFLFFADFAWFREQFCIIACPYGRFQSVLLDKESLIVGYKDSRGEPREKYRKGERSAGDCIDCNRCVAVCPTGIDIRMGLQMECINCTACMDACDEVMTKIDKPKELIGYTSIAAMEGRARKFVRPRVVAYLILLIAMWSIGTTLLMRQDRINIRLIRPPGASFTLAESSLVTNHFQVKATNKSHNDITLELQVGADYQLVAPINPWTIPAQSTATNQIFIRKEHERFAASGKEKVRVYFLREGKLAYDTEITLMGPIK